MDTALQKQIITVIEDEWRRLPESQRPFGAWIRRYSPLPIGADDTGSFEVMPEAVWFLDEKGLRVENVWSWMRFVKMQRFTMDLGVRYSMPLIGLAAFALYVDGQSCYSETQWGPRFGRGWRWRLEDGRLRGRDPIWVS